MKRKNILMISGEMTLKKIQKHILLATSLLIGTLFSCGTESTFPPGLAKIGAELNSAFDLQAKGDNEGAKAAYQKVLEEQPRDISTRLNLANLQLNTGSTDDAIKTFQSILQDDPENVIASSGLAASLEKAGRNEEAKQIKAKSANGLQVSDGKIKEVKKPDFLGKEVTLSATGEGTHDEGSSINIKRKIDIINNEFYFYSEVLVNFKNYSLSRSSNYKNVGKSLVEYKLPIGMIAQISQSDDYSYYFPSVGDSVAYGVQFHSSVDPKTPIITTLTTGIERFYSFERIVARNIGKSCLDTSGEIIPSAYTEGQPCGYQMQENNANQLKIERLNTLRKAREDELKMLVINDKVESESIDGIERKTTFAEKGAGKVLTKYDYEEFIANIEPTLSPLSHIRPGYFQALYVTPEEKSELTDYISSLPGNRLKKIKSANSTCSAETGNVPSDYNPESPSYKYKGSHSETVYSLLNNLSKLQISYKLPTDPDLCGSGGSSPPDFFAQGLLSGTDTVKVGNVPVLKNCQRDFLVAAATLNAYAAAGYSRKIGTRSDGKTAAQLAEESAGVMMKNLTAADALKDTGDIAPNGLFALGVTTNCWSGVLYP